MDAIPSTNHWIFLTYQSQYAFPVSSLDHYGTIFNITHHYYDTMLNSILWWINIPQVKCIRAIHCSAVQCIMVRYCLVKLREKYCIQKTLNILVCADISIDMPYKTKINPSDLQSHWELYIPTSTKCWQTDLQELLKCWLLICFLSFHSNKRHPFHVIPKG